MIATTMEMEKMTNLIFAKCKLDLFFFLYNSSVWVRLWVYYFLLTNGRKVATGVFVSTN